MQIAIRVSLAVALTMAALAGPPAATQAATATSLSGTVWGYPYLPLAGAVVVVRDGSGIVARAVTDRQGRYSAVGGFYGPVTIDVMRDGYTTEQRTCLLDPGDATHADFSILGASAVQKADPEYQVDPYGPVDVYDGASLTRRTFPALTRECVPEPASADHYFIY